MEQPYSIVTCTGEDVNNINSEVEEKEVSNNNNVKASVDELELLKKLEEANR